jgi:hypothetical protein
MQLARSLLRFQTRRCMSSTAAVFVDKNTKVIVQGFTGKQVRLVVGRPFRPLSLVCAGDVPFPAGD